jgi:outer membrane cobalamin receptor
MLLLLAACAGRPRAFERDRNVIRADEIAQVQVTTAYDVVARLRGAFLKTRGTVTRTPGRTTDRAISTEQPKITVFLDGVEAGPVEQTLYLIPASEVFEIRLYRAADAVTKYGSRHTGGVIAVTTKRAGR